jgi:hypothetical protein
MHESFTAADRSGASSGCKPFEDYSVDDDDDKNNCGAFSTVSNKELDWELFDKCFKDNFLFKKKLPTIFFYFTRKAEESSHPNLLLLFFWS